MSQCDGYPEGGTPASEGGMGPYDILIPTTDHTFFKLTLTSLYKFTPPSPYQFFTQNLCNLAQESTPLHLSGVPSPFGVYFFLGVGDGSASLNSL
jgi:hypothetical protein